MVHNFALVIAFGLFYVGVKAHDWWKKRKIENPSRFMIENHSPTDEDAPNMHVNAVIGRPTSSVGEWFSILSKLRTAIGMSLIVGRIRPYLDKINASVAPLPIAGPVVDDITHDDVAQKLRSVFEQFEVKASVVAKMRGPMVTRYEIELGRGVKVEQIIKLTKNIAYAVKCTEVHILSPVPGKSVVGIEIPNAIRDTVSLDEVINSVPAISDPHPLTVGLGKDIEGNYVLANLTKMPHILIAGTTGSGKSVCLNAIICSVLSRATPDQVRMLLIDPKRVELVSYAKVPHLVASIVTDPQRASEALGWVVHEMNVRYDDLAKVGAKNIDEYNKKLRNGVVTDEQFQQYPYLLVVIDELADLMMVAAHDVEESIIRIAQLARAAGIHLILATQRPSVDVVTGRIKANVPSRLAFSTSSMTDSRVILDQPGAEKLTGSGDGLFHPVGSAKPVRFQGAQVTDEDVDRIVSTCKGLTSDAQHVSFNMPTMELPVKSTDIDPEQDELELLIQAVELVVNSQIGSTSMIQRKLKVGFTKAGRLMDLMELYGVVDTAVGSKTRNVLVQPCDIEKILMRIKEQD